MEFFVIIVYSNCRFFKMSAANASGSPDIPNNQRELVIQNAKAYLLQNSTKSNTNL